MKKSVWIVIGLLVVIGAGLLISRPEDSGKPDVLKRTQETPRLGSGQEAGSDGSDVEQTSLSAQRQAEMPAPLALSDAVKALVGLDGKKHNYPSLLVAISELDEEISADDVAALREMLNFPNDRFPEKMRSIGINAVKNDVLALLLRQKELPEGLGLQMVEMASNAENDPVWRDYCIQFMEPFYERASSVIDLSTEGHGGVSVDSVTSSAAGGKSNGLVDELSAIQDAMFSALDERDNTIAGTALIGLELLSRTHEEFDRETIVVKASEIALDETASSASRLTALRLSASGNLKLETGNLKTQVVDAARSLAQTGETVLLRSAAIVTLGEVGSSDDRELLESYLLDGNKQIADAAKMALIKMDSEPSQPVGPIDPEIIGEATTKPQSTEKLPPILIN